MLSGESIFTKKACIADAPVICFTPNARMASGVKVSNAEANFSVSISRQSASIQSGVLSSSVRVFDIFIVLQRAVPCATLCGLQLTGGGVGGICGLGVEGDRRVWRGPMDDVHHGLEQRQAFGRESEAPASAFSSIALPAASGVIMQVSPFHPCSSIFVTPKAIPALIFSALKPGGREGSEKSTVSGFWPTNRILVIWFLLSVGVEIRETLFIARDRDAGIHRRLAPAG